MATKAKNTLVSSRYPHEMPKAEIFEDLRAQLERHKPEDFQTEWETTILDLANGAAEFGGRRFNLSANAEAQLCERLKMGAAHEILSPSLYGKVEREFEAYAQSLEGSLTVKHRGEIASGILTERYKEIPYDLSVSVLEDVGARPIRLTLNEQLVKIQATFDPKDFEPISPKDGEPVSLGVQMRSSDVGKSSLHFEVFTYRWICANGMVFGKNNLFKFRAVHLSERGATSAETDKEIRKVLEVARREIEARTNQLIGMKLDETKRLQIVNFLGKRNDIGKRAAEALLLPIVQAVNVYDVVNLLTAEGHNPQHKPSLQMAFEQAAGDLMLLATA